MAEQKTYSIKIDGIEQSVKGVESLGENVSKTGNAWKETQKALKEVKAEMAGLDKNSAQWQELAKVAGEYRDKLDDINQAARRFASDTKALDDAINIGQSMTSVFTLAQGAMSAFGLSTDDVVESIQKLQGAMAILQSLQTLQNTLRGSTATSDLLSKSMKALTVSMEGASTGAKALKVALMGIGIGIIIALISELIIHWEDLTEALGFATKAQEEANEVMEAGTKAYAKGKAELEAYTAKINAFNGSKEQEKQLVDELNKKYGDAFGHYETLAQWKDILKKKTEAYCKTLLLEAQMQAKVNQLTQAYEKVANAKKEWDRVKKGDLTYLEQIKDFFNPGGTFHNAKDNFNQARNNVTNLEDEIDVLAKQIVENNMNNDLFMGGTTKTIKNLKKTVEVVKNQLGDWLKAEKKGLEAAQALKDEIDKKDKKAFEEEQKRLERLKKLRKDNSKAENDWQKQNLKLQLANAKTEEEKIEIKKKIIDLDEKIAEQEAKNAAAEAMGMSMEELETRLSNIDTTYFNLSEESKQTMQTLITMLSTIKMGADVAKAALNGDSSSSSSNGSTDSGTKMSGQNRFRYSKLSKEDNPFGNFDIDFDAIRDTINDAYDAYVSPVVDGYFNTIQMMLDFAIEEAEAKLEEATVAHDEAVEKVTESQDKIAELNDKMKDSSGAQLEQYKQQMVDEMLLLQQREQEEKRLQKEKEKREKELEKEKKRQRKAELQQQLIQAMVSGALAVVNGLATQPFVPVGIAMGALAGTLSAIQQALIIKQISKLADGGLLTGPSHANGGIPVGNTGVEVEGGEFVVSKRATAKYLPLLDAINAEGNGGKHVINNPKSMFADGGQLNYQRIDDNFNQLNGTAAIANAIGSIDFHPVVSVVDINRGQRNYTEVRQLAGANN